MKQGPKRDWAEREAQCWLDNALHSKYSAYDLAKLLRRTGKREYERGLNARDPMTGIRTDLIRYTGPHGKLMKARERDRSEG